MAYICPLMSTAEKQVPCTTNCALFLKDGKNATCSINISAIHTLEIRKAVELLGRDDRRQFGFGVLRHAIRFRGEVQL